MDNDNVRSLLRIGTYPATKTQVAVLVKAGNDAIDIFQKLVWTAIEAHDAFVYLPHINENGEPVQNGSNRMMEQIKDRYMAAAQALVLMIPDKDGRDWFPWMYVRNVTSRGTEGLPKWMQWVIDKNDGVIPTEWSNSDVMSDDVVNAARRNEGDS